VNNSRLDGRIHLRLDAGREEEDDPAPPLTSPSSVTAGDSDGGGEREAAVEADKLASATEKLKAQDRGAGGLRLEEDGGEPGWSSCARKEAPAQHVVSKDRHCKVRSSRSEDTTDSPSESGSMDESQDDLVRYDVSQGDSSFGSNRRSGGDLAVRLDNLAIRLRGTIKKFPTAGRGIFSSARERYFAVAGDGAALGRDAEPERWEGASLRYWEDHIAYTEKDEPYGGVPIGSIQQVVRDKKEEKGCLIRVRYLKDGQEQCLQLLFTRAGAAEAWGSNLKDFCRTYASWRKAGVH